MSHEHPTPEEKIYSKEYLMRNFKSELDQLESNTEEGVLREHLKGRRTQFEGILRQKFSSVKESLHIELFESFDSLADEFAKYREDFEEKVTAVWKKIADFGQESRQQYELFENEAGQQVAAIDARTDIDSAKKEDYKGMVTESKDQRAEALKGQISQTMEKLRNEHIPLQEEFDREKELFEKSKRTLLNDFSDRYLETIVPLVEEFTK